MDPYADPTRFKVGFVLTVGATGFLFGGCFVDVIPLPGWLFLAVGVAAVVAYVASMILLEENSRVLLVGAAAAFLLLAGAGRQVAESYLPAVMIAFMTFQIVFWSVIAVIEYRCYKRL